MYLRKAVWVGIAASLYLQKFRRAAKDKVVNNRDPF
jgi:hypothetical protein